MPRSSQELIDDGYFVLSPSAQDRLRLLFSEVAEKEHDRAMRDVEAVAEFLPLDYQFQEFRVEGITGIVTSDPIEALQEISEQRNSPLLIVSAVYRHQTLPQGHEDALRTRSILYVRDEGPVYLNGVEHSEPVHALHLARAVTAHTPDFQIGNRQL